MQALVSPEKEGIQKRIFDVVLVMDSSVTYGEVAIAGVSI
jgi:hypothetical protein